MGGTPVYFNHLSFHVLVQCHPVARHEIAQRSLPLMFIGAGLPQIAALAGNAKSYAERLLTYPQMGPLEPTAAQAETSASDEK